MSRFALTARSAEPGQDADALLRASTDVLFDRPPMTTAASITAAMDLPVSASAALVAESRMPLDSSVLKELDEIGTFLWRASVINAC